MNQQHLFDREFHGLLAEFSNPDDLVRAAERAWADGYRRIDAFSPVPVHGLAEAMGMTNNRVPLVMLAGAVTGAAFGYGLQVFMAGLTYVHNIGGRPIHSWPAFVPVTFETTVLFSALFGVIGTFAMNGLPRPHHPVFDAPRFELASQERFFLWIDSSDRQFEINETRDYLRTLKAADVVELYA